MAFETISVLDPSGHLVLEWDPNDKESVAKAEAEWAKLKEAGFVFFAEGTETDAMSAGVTARGRVEARVPVQVEPEAVKPQRGRRGPRKAIAVPRMRGG